MTNGGRVLEAKGMVERDGSRISCDGTVPSWSMQYLKTWISNNCYVTLDTIDGAPRFEILVDARFHGILSS